MTDYYAALGVERIASQHEITRAYRRLARALHPDKNSAPTANERFVQVNEAYRVLGDVEMRKTYDAYGQHGLDQGWRMTPEQAKKQFWDVFKVPFQNRGKRPASAVHGAYVAAVGGVSAPFTGATLGVGISGASLGYGGYMMGSGLYAGGKDFGHGVAALGHGKVEGKWLKSSVSKPVTGVLHGGTLGVGGVAVGLGGGVLGGVGGAYRNVRQGGHEIYDSWHHKHPMPVPGKNNNNTNVQSTALVPLPKEATGKG